MTGRYLVSNSPFLPVESKQCLAHMLRAAWTAALCWASEAQTSSCVMQSPAWAPATSQLHMLLDLVNAMCRGHTQQ